MPQIDLDFGGINDVPEGWFRLTVDKAIYKPNKAGTAMVLNLQLHLTDMPPGCIPGTETEYEQFENRPVYDSTSMQPQVRWRLQKVLAAITGKDWSEDGMHLDFVCEEDCEQFAETEKCSHNKRIPDLEEKTVVGLVVGEEYEGNMNLKVKKWVEDNGSVEFGPDFTE